MKQTTVDRITEASDGTLQVRFLKEETDGSGVVISRTWHRTTLPPGKDVDVRMAAVNSHLSAKLGYTAVAASGVNSIKTAASAAWTTPVLNAFGSKTTNL